MNNLPALDLLPTFRGINHRKNIFSRFGSATSIVAVTTALMLASGTAQALTVNLDGIMNSDDTAYTTSKSVNWYNDHQGTQFPDGGSSLQVTNVKYGTGTLAGGGSTDYWFLFIEAPLAAKNLVWGTGASNAEINLYKQQYDTHHSPLSNNPANDKDYFDFDKAFGSEKFIFNGITADPKVTKNNTFLGDNVSGATGLVNAISSISYVLDSGICNTDGCDQSLMTMAFEFQFEMSAAANMIAYFNNPKSKINTHLSPERGGALTVVPLPASLPLYGAGLALMGFIGWRKKRRKETV